MNCARTSAFFFSAFSSYSLIWPSMRLLIDPDTQHAVNGIVQRT